MKYLIVVVACVALFASCGDEGAARKQLELARATFGVGELNNAKKQIDTIKVLYPKEYKVILEGIHLMREIELLEQNRNIVFCDSMLQQLAIEVEPLKKGLTLQKDTLYEEMGHWISKRQTVERNVKRCYIRSGVSEDGIIYLSSVFYGKGALKHTALKVSIPDGQYAQTEEIAFDGGLNYRFEDLGMTTEIVTYRQPRDNGVIEFIYTHADEKKLKVEYVGGKPYVIYMDEQARMALKDVYNLGVVLANIERLKRERALSVTKVAYLEKKLKSKQEEARP